MLSTLNQYIYNKYFLQIYLYLMYIKYIELPYHDFPIDISNILNTLNICNTSITHFFNK